MSKPANQVDLTSRHLRPDGKVHYAIYLPAISGFYTKQLGLIKNNADHVPEGRTPAGFENGFSGLDFLDKENAYFHYKWGLYSAGHADRNLNKCNKSEPMIHGRSEDTVIVGDSGGFQIATGVIKTDWSKFDTVEGDALREDILRYLEHTADWSMTLDVPAFAAAPPLSAKTGLTKFEDTLRLSIHNLHYFMKHRVPGKTKFLNVLSGSTFENANQWYEGVKPFSDPKKVVEMGYTADRTLEGFAFAGIHMRNMKLALLRMLDLIYDGIIQDKGWIHFLGLGRLDWACFLTSIMREIQKKHNPNLQISFDAASPFVSVAYGLSYNYNSFFSKKFTYGMGNVIDRKDMEGNYSRMPFQSPVMDRLTVHDVCPLSKAHAIVNGVHDYSITEEECALLKENGVDATWQGERLNKLGKSSKTSWDTLTYLLYMGHNVYQHIQAVQEANRIADVEYDRLRPHWSQWVKDRRSSKSAEISDFVPAPILYFRSFVEELFALNTKEDQIRMIEDFSPFLESISFGPPGEHTFNSLFSFESATNDESNIDQFADINDEKLMAIERDDNNE